MIAIVIVAHNSRDDLFESISSIIKNDFQNYKIIVVDNASTDGTYDLVKKRFRKIELIKNKNTGYAGGNNLGIKRAIKLKSDYILVLNPDTILDKNCLRSLDESKQEDTIIQPLILLDKTRLVNTTGSYLNFLGFSYCNNYKKPANQFHKKQEIALASGAASLISVKILKKIGLFDEDFFMYHEDIDLFWRARANGYKILFVPEAKVFHKYSFSKNKNKMYLSERNRLVFLYKNFSLKYLILIFPISVVNELLLIIYALLSGWLGQKISSYFAAAKIIKGKKIGKKKNLKKIVSSQGKLKKFIGSELSFSEVKNPLLVPYNALLWLYFKLIYLFV